MTVCSRFIILFYRDESLAALHEAIRMAQETNDHECLQHALVSNAVFRSPLAETEACVDMFLASICPFVCMS